jgi:hypothetical protein
MSTKEIRGTIEEEEGVKRQEHFRVRSVSNKLLVESSTHANCGVTYRPSEWAPDKATISWSLNPIRPKTSLKPAALKGSNKSD